MRKDEKKLYIRYACFLTAFAAVGAGFAYRANNAKELGIKREKSYQEMMIYDSAENLQGLSDSFEGLLSAPKNERNIYLSDIRMYAELSKNSLGYMDIKGKGAEELFRFLTGASILSENAIELGFAEEAAAFSEFSKEAPVQIDAFDGLSRYAIEVSNEAIPLLSVNTNLFEEKVADIFSDTGSETILYESGYGVSSPKTLFSFVSGGKIKEREAMEAAKKYLGKRAYLKAELSVKHPSAYHIRGENISAVISENSGYLMQLLFDIPSGEKRIDEDTAKEIADKFLKDIGFVSEKTEIVNKEQREGLYIFEYIPIADENILCLNEKILVGVSHGSGRICLFDAVNYYKYHTKSLTLPEGMLSPSEAAEMHGLDAAGVRLCKIERTEGVESLCYRFVKDGTHFYISALSGMKLSV
ncbi:MAG: germination protein YpeB [Clostridia bacterium]|nr:germination protein YpeB [Clostridia bacterium]